MIAPTFRLKLVKEKGTAYKVTMNGPRDAAEIAIKMIGDNPHESLVVIAMDVINNVVGVFELYRGTQGSTVVRIGEVFKPALLMNAASIIVAHNHPSGQLNPSPDDAHVTRQLVAAGQLLDVEVLDHIIVNSESFASMRERGIGF